MFNFLYIQYTLGKLTFEQFKSLLTKYNLKDNVNIVENTETNELKFTLNDYTLKTSEKFLDEASFWS